MTVCKVAPISFMLLLLPCTCLGSGGGGGSSHNSHGDARKYHWTYFETPVGKSIGSVGPTKWKDLGIANNQCGGNGQKEGFGQSPVRFPFEKEETCDGDMSGYSFRAGNCSYADLIYEIRRDALYVSTPSHCHLGEATIPGIEGITFDAREIRVTIRSEHSVENSFASYEMQILHHSKDTDKMVAFAFQVNIADTEKNHPFFEILLRGWTDEHSMMAHYCTNHSKGSKIYESNTDIESKQRVVDCGLPTDDFNDYWPWNLTSADTRRGLLSSSMQEEGTDLVPGGPTVPSLFENGTLLDNDKYGFIAYKGSLTKPPCTEKVYWSFADKDIKISLSQAIKIESLALCRVEKSTCKHGSAASEFGATIRPPQPLEGRKTVHYCGEESVENFTIPQKTYVNTTAPTSKKYKPPKQFKDYYAILFPCLVLATGVVIYYGTTRYLHLFPYTANMFLIGTIIGILIKVFPDYNILNNSVTMNSNINNSVMLMVFLPGLLFKEAYGLDSHLFLKGVGQIAIMGFPMVLAGTYLMGLVAYYILPYGWNFNLCLTFGAIVAATDPAAVVTVSALLNELGAPPRLRVHISGESLLNDGAAAVLFTIFKELFYYDKDIPGGNAIGWGEGFRMFFKMSLAAALMGVAFGLALMLFLRLLNRRYNKEEAITQVCATFGVAYLSFYVAEGVFHMSGVISVVFCGITMKAAAPTVIIDHGMMDSFWSLIENILNTIFFALGGVAWGTVISNRDETRPEGFDARGWGYLLVIYIFMSLIRLFNFSLFYPIITNIGLKSNKNEMLFLSLIGLRGAVGIALAISLDNGVREITSELNPTRNLTTQVYALTGGVTLFSLFVNGTLAGPLLKKFQLTRASDERKKRTESYEGSIKRHTLSYLLQLLSEQRFSNVDFKIIKKYVKNLDNLTCSELKSAVIHLRDSTPSDLYHVPNLSVFDNYFANNPDELNQAKEAAKIKISDRVRNAMVKGRLEEVQTDKEEVSDKALIEIRLVYMELLRKAYDEDTKRGEITQQPLNQWLLSQSIAIMEDKIVNGMEIKDWEATQSSSLLNNLVETVAMGRKEVMRAMIYLSAHRKARGAFLRTFIGQGSLSSAEKLVLKEVDVQTSLAQKALDAHDPEKVRSIASYLLCSALLNNACVTVSEFTEAGLLKGMEAEDLIEHFDHQIHHLEDTFNAYLVLEEEEEEKNLNKVPPPV